MSGDFIILPVIFHPNACPADRRQLSCTVSVIIRSDEKYQWRFNHLYALLL